jgi:hypothetical protein
MSKLFIISLYSLFLANILCENVVHYISPSGAGSKDGTKEILGVGIGIPLPEI